MSTAPNDPPRDTLARLRIQRETAPQRPSAIKRLFKGLVTLAIILLLLVGGGYGAWKIGLIPRDAWWLEFSEAMKDKPQVRLATVAVETGRSGDATVIATGYLESRRQAKIGARAAGRIEAVNVEEGDRVTAQQILAVLEHADLDASLAATKATAARATAELGEQEITISQAKRDFDRAQKLKNTSSISEAEFEEARFKFESATARRDSLQAAVALSEARVREAEQMKENMFIRAPFDGTVISKDAEVGESILPGGMGEASGRGSAVTIADLAHLEVDCDVKEDYISRVSVDQPAEVAVDAVPGRKYSGRFARLFRWAIALALRSKSKSRF